MFSPKEIQQLKKMYKEEFGADIGDREIVECAQFLLNLLAAVYGPVDQNTSTETPKNQDNF